MALKYEEFIERIERLAALESRDAAERALRATLKTLAERLLADERRLVAEQLPRGLAEEVLSPQKPGVFDSKEFFERVAAREGVGPGYALEHVQSVCEVLGTVLDSTTLRRLRGELGDDFADLFPRWDAQTLVHREPHSLGYPERQERSSRTGQKVHGRTLATGRPGSSRPLSVARPMQWDSILETDNPHEGGKISSGSRTVKQRRETEEKKSDKDRSR